MIQAITDNLHQSYLSFGRTTGGKVGLEPDMKWIYSGSRLLNRVFDAHFQGDPVPRIRHIQSRFSKWVQPFNWVCAPSTEPSNLGAYLVRQGLVHHASWFGMALRRDVWLPLDLAPLDYQLVHSPDLLRVWTGNVVDSFGGMSLETMYAIFSGMDDSRWRYFLGYFNGEPVSAVSLLATGETVGVYWVAVLPAVRGRGIAARLLNTLLAQEIDSDQTSLVVLQSVQAAHNLYLRLGFEDSCQFDIYRWIPEGH